jgi:hypothetical protein
MKRWGGHAPQYGTKGSVRVWSDLSPQSQQRFLDTFMSVSPKLRFWPKTPTEWAFKKGVKFLHDGSGYVMNVAEAGELNGERREYVRSKGS